MGRWEGEGGTASASGDLSSSIGASAPVVEAPVVPVITIQDETMPQLEAPHVSIRTRFGVDPDKYLDHGSIVLAAITSCTTSPNPFLLMQAWLFTEQAGDC